MVWLVALLVVVIGAGLFVRGYQRYHDVLTGPWIVDDSTWRD